MTDIPKDKLDEFVAACRQAGAYGLLSYSSGNLSWRIGEDLALVSCKGSWLGEIRADQVVLCRIGERTVLNGKTPSVETRFHCGVLRVRPEFNVVFHFQSPYATAIACGNPHAVNFHIIPEIPFYIGEPGVIDYMKPGSEELALAVIEGMKTHDLLVLRNHGLVTAGCDFHDAFQRAGFFELACKILLHQPRPVWLTPAAVADLKARGISKSKGV